MKVGKAHAKKRLVMSRDIPVDAAIPTDRIADVIGIDDVIVVREIPVGIRGRVQIQNALGDRVDLTGAEDVLLAVA